MKGFVLGILGFAVLPFFLVTGLGSPAQAGSVFQCTGGYGDLIVAFTSAGYRLRGTIKENSSDQVGVQRECNGELRKQSSAYSYFNADKECPADYLRVDNALLTSGEGGIVLVNTSGGDTHDYSGYVYRVFKCTQK